LAALEEALDASEEARQGITNRIADLGSRLNVALAQRVQELSRYRSEFFGRLRAILGIARHPVVGDRFVFQSEVFFDTGGSDAIARGRAELDTVANALIELDKKIRRDRLGARVDGHTDVRPVSGRTFKSNWEPVGGAGDLGGAYLISLGVPAQRLVAARLGEFSRSIPPTPKTPTAQRRKRVKLRSVVSALHLRPTWPLTKRPRSTFGIAPAAGLSADRLRRALEL